MIQKKIGNYLFPSSDTHFERWILNGEYQKKQRDTLFEYMENKRKIEYIIDVGAHVGLWSRPMIQRPDTKYIWAFEPNSSVRECYVQNMKDFDNYTIYPFALGSHQTTGFLNIEKDNSGNTNIDPDKPGNVEIKSIDSMNFENVDYIKVDAEGFEYQILSGCLETLSKNKPFIHLEMKSKRMRNTFDEFNILFNKIGYKEVKRVSAEVLYDYNT
jgi:FkbM family methyltransferase|tara:strand:- start:23 stop:664 length:642 start_codon:yes stop_codon:yes gene_type:complete